MKHTATQGSILGPLIFCCPSFSGPNWFQKNSTLIEIIPSERTLDIRINVHTSNLYSLLNASVIIPNDRYIPIVLSD